MPGTFNLVTDFGGDLANWNNYAATSTGLVTLNVPAGTYTSTDSGNSSIAASGETVIIQGAGVGVTELRIGGIGGAGAMPPNGNDLANNPNPMPRIYSVDAGAASVRLLIASKASLFVVGHWALLCGMETQYTGYPQNFQNFEFIKVASANTTTGVVTFETQIQYPYRAYWPDSPSFNQFAADLGGAAGLWPILNTARQSTPPPIRNDGIQNWALDVTVRDCTIRGFGGGNNVFFGGSRRVTWEDCDFPGYSVTPGGSSDYILRNCTISNGSNVFNTEVDKLIEYLEFDNCTWSGTQGMGVQSGSIHRMYIHGCTLASLSGTTGETVIEDSSVGDLQIGTSFYGHCKSVVIDNVVATDVEGTTQSPAQSLPTSDYTLSNGVITMTRTKWESGSLQIPARVVPKSAQLLNGQFGRYWKAIQVKDLYAPYPSNSVGIRTTALDAGEIGPAFTNPNYGGAARHPCTDVTFTNFSGCSEARVLNRYPAANMPLYSYYHSGIWNGVGTSDACEIFGQWVSLKVNVLTAYTGVVAGLKMTPGGFFGTSVLLDDWTFWHFRPFIDLTVTGERVFTPGSTTGFVGTDTFANQNVPGNLPANALWISAALQNGQFAAEMNADISGESSSVYPAITIEFIVDQDLVPESELELDAIANYTPITGGGQTHVITKNIYKGY